jgi:hypothetical protein
VLAGPMIVTSQMTEAATLAVLKTAIRVAQGNPDALMFVGHFAKDSRQAIQDTLWDAWPLFDRVEYARIVLRRCSVARTEVIVDDPTVPAAVAFLSEVHVMIVNRGTVDLSPLRGRSDLTVVLRGSATVVGDNLLGKGSKIVEDGSVEEPRA